MPIALRLAARRFARKAKAALYRSLHSTLEEMLDVEIDDQQALFATPEARQLIRNR